MRFTNATSGPARHERAVRFEADSAPGSLRGVISAGAPALKDDRSVHGRAFGAPGETFGQAVFATGMSGYQETLTDPSYHRQVVIATAPHIGNTGWNDEDSESSRIWVAGYVVRDAARISSNWRARRDLEVELRAQGIVGMSEVDTRALTRHIREQGAMRVGISSVETNAAALLERVQDQPSMVGAHLADEVSTTEAYVVRPDGEPQFRVAAVDLGIKSMTPARMAERGLEVHVVPSTVSFAEIRRCGRTACSSQTAPVTRKPLTSRWRSSGLCWQPASRTSVSASAISCSVGRWASAPSSWGTGTVASTSQ